MHTSKSYLLALCILTLVLFFPASLEAAGARIIFEGEKTVAPGQEFLVKVLLDSGGTPINALSGTIHMDGAVIKEIRDGGSVVPLWIDRPTISSTGTEVSFSGIVPGSFSGKGELMQFIAVVTDVPGLASKDSILISLSEVQAFSPGQEPISINVQNVPLTISISGNGNASTTTLPLEDTISPEPFSISIETNPDIFDAAPFVIFLTQDKQSGIDHYEASFSFIRAPSDGEWQTVESPYRLPREAVGKIIYIKAVDHEGNTTVVHIAGPGYYRNLTILAILLILVICTVSFFVRRKTSRKS